MNKIRTATFGLALVLIFASQAAVATATAPATQSAVLSALDKADEEIDKGLNEIIAAKAELKSLDEELEKATEEIGPDAKEIYDLLKTRAKAAIRKGVDWVKKKLAEKFGKLAEN